METFISPIYNYGYNNNEEVCNYLLPLIKNNNSYKKLLENILMNSNNNLDFSLKVFSENSELSYLNDLHYIFINNLIYEEKNDKDIFEKYNLQNIFNMHFNFHKNILIENDGTIIIELFINNGSFTIKTRIFLFLNKKYNHKYFMKFIETINIPNSKCDLCIFNDEK